jgi:uncharacterized Tic20 family protein
MSTQGSISQDEKVMGALAHGSILLGVLTSGIGGVIAALVIWITQKEKSAYVAFQALQAVVYQTVIMIVTVLAWCCWGAVWMAMFLPPIIADPRAYDTTVPAGFWVGMALMIVPVAIWAITILYGLWGAVRCLGGYDFRYAIIGRWLEGQT